MRPGGGRRRRGPRFGAHPRARRPLRAVGAGNIRHPRRGPPERSASAARAIRRRVARPSNGWTTLKAQKLGSPSPFQRHRSGYRLGSPPHTAASAWQPCCRCCLEAAATLVSPEISGRPAGDPRMEVRAGRSKPNVGALAADSETRCVGTSRPFPTQGGGSARMLSRTSISASQTATWSAGCTRAARDSVSADSTCRCCSSSGEGTWPRSKPTRCFGNSATPSTRTRECDAGRSMSNCQELWMRWA